MNTYEQRLTALEESLTHWRRATIVLGAAFLLLAAAAAQPPDLSPAPDLIRAQSFQVVDDDGHILLTLRANQLGHGLLESFTKDGRRAALISTNEGRNGVVGVYNEKGEWVTALTTDDQGRGELEVLAAEKQLIARVGANGRGQGAVVVRAAGAEISAAAVSLNERNDGILEIWNSRGQRVVVAGASESGEGLVKMFKP